MAEFVTNTTLGEQSGDGVDARPLEDNRTVNAFMSLELAALLASIIAGLVIALQIHSMVGVAAIVWTPVALYYCWRVNR